MKSLHFSQLNRDTPPSWSWLIFCRRVTALVSITLKAETVSRTTFLCRPSYGVSFEVLCPSTYNSSRLHSAQLNLTIENVPCGNENPWNGLTFNCCGFHSEFQTNYLVLFMMTDTGRRSNTRAKLLIGDD